MSAGSARGLFRATGNATKSVHVRDLVTGEIVKADGLPRDPHDFDPTPPEPTRAFLAAELARLREFAVLVEPACGDGAMVREMLALGFAVVASDLIDRGFGAQRDFYDYGPDDFPPNAALVTNPPFKECNTRDGQARWLWHALDVLNVEYMALLLSWTWPGAGGLASFWAKYPPARVYLMRWKIDFTGQGSPPMLNGWFVWDKKSAGSQTTLHMLDRLDARQGELTFEESEQPELEVQNAPSLSNRDASADGKPCLPDVANGNRAIDERQSNPSGEMPAEDLDQRCVGERSRHDGRTERDAAEVQQCASAAPAFAEASAGRPVKVDVSGEALAKPDDFEIPTFLRRDLPAKQAEAA